MADQVKYPGRLIAIDGSRGKDIHAAADAVAGALKALGVECAISRWDASGLFSELMAGAERDISIRSLSLVYAADLAFRLRWEIRPVLEAGGVVIAAPYLETAIAFGGSCGLEQEWVRRLLRFAPPASAHGRTEERKADRPWKRRADRGYCELGALILDASAPKRASRAARRVMMAALDHPRGHRAVKLDARGVHAIVRAITGSRTGAANRRSSRPRSGRK